MRRIYYLVNRIEDAEAISDALHEEGITDWHFHVLAKDEAGLIQHKLHAATTYQQLDPVHTGGRFGLVGALVGLLLGVCGYVLAGEGLLGFAFGPAAVVLLTAVGGLFGAWQGGMVGMSRENYKLARFHDEIDAGRYLVMVDVNAQRKGDIRELMSLRFPQAEFGGSDSTLINPFARAPVLPQTTH